MKYTLRGANYERGDLELWEAKAIIGAMYNGALPAAIIDPNGKIVDVRAKAPEVGAGGWCGRD